MTEVKLGHETPTEEPEASEESISQFVVHQLSPDADIASVNNHLDLIQLTSG